MYTQAIDVPNQQADEAKRGPTPLEPAAYQAEFDAKLARGDFIEAKDWMPEAYRKTRWCARSPSTRIPRSWACCPRATGSRGRPR